MRERERIIVERWRRRADDLDRYARLRRRDGDPAEAEDAEQAALDYRIAADDLEAECDRCAELGYDAATCRRFCSELREPA